MIVVKKFWSLLMILYFPTFAFAVRIDPVLTVDQEKSQVRITVNGMPALTSPQEGLWSIATGWQDQWPAEWHHTHFNKVAMVDGWTIVHGKLAIDEGDWQLRESYRPAGDKIEVVRRFEWHGKNILGKCTLSVRWQTPSTDVEPLMPGILYYSNPSGAKSGRVATWGKDAPEAIFEEHRYPMPFACLETQTDKDADRLAVALHTIPSTAPYSHKTDQWWSLGAVKKVDCTELILLSGPCAANGKHSVVKARQSGLMEYPDTYLNIPPGAIIEKRYFLQAADDFSKGSGFRPAVKTSIDIFKPFVTEGLPTFDQILKAKYRFAMTRWHEGETSAGFRKYPNNDSPYVMGWCGRAAVPGYAVLAMADRLDDSGALKMAQRSLDFLATSPFNDQGFLVWYEPAPNRWSRQDPVSQGQAMEIFARAIAAGRKISSVDTSRWEAFLRRACDVHATRILEDTWQPKSTAEAFFVSPLCKAYKLFGIESHRRAAVKAAEHYAKRHLDMAEPYWGGTLDASCEDKEGAWAAFQAFLAVYELDKDPKYLQWAEHAMDVTLTYTVVWDIDMPPGRLRDHHFKSRGWTVVSAQNQHLDMFGVVYTPEIYRMGDYLRRDDLKRLAKVMYRTCGQLVDPYGSQGEQIQHTNFAQSGDMSNVYKMRGGYSEGWTVFWITAHFLSAAAQFEEMGVSMRQ